MEILRQSLLNTGGGARYDYYTITATFDFDPSNTNESKDIFTVIKQVVSQKAEIVDDIIVRTYKNEDTFNMPQEIVNAGKKYEVYQYLFSVSAHNNGWESIIDLKEALGAASVPQKLYPVNDGVYSLARFESINGGLSLFFFDIIGTALESRPAQIRVSGSAPMPTQGRYGDVILHMNELDNVIRYYIRLKDEWHDITTKITFFSGDAPVSADQFQLKVDGIKFSQYTDGKWNTPQDVKFKFSPADVVDTELFLYHTNNGTELYKTVDGVVKRVQISSKIVLDEFDFVRNLYTGDHNKSFNVLINNDALVGADIAKLSNTTPEGDGIVRIYRNSLAETNLVAETKNLIWKSKETQAIIDIVNANTTMIIDTPDTVSYFNDNNGTTDNIFKNYIQYPLANVGYVSSPTTQGTPYFTSSTVYPHETRFIRDTNRTYSFGKVAGLGGDSKLTVTIKNSDAAQSQTYVFATTENGTSSQGPVTVTIGDLAVDSYGRSIGTISAAINNDLACNVIDVPTEHAGLIDVTFSHGDSSRTSPIVNERYFYNNPQGAINSDPLIVSLNTDPNTTVKYVSGVPILTKDAVLKYSISNIQNSLNYVTPTDMFVSLLGSFGEIKSSPWVTKPNITYPNFTGVFDNTYSYEVLLPVTSNNVIQSTDNWITTINRGDVNVVRTASIGPLLIDPNIGQSTDLYENFSDETYRIDGADQPWNSLNALTILDAAQFMGALGVIDEIYSVKINGIDTEFRDFTNAVIPGPNYSAIQAVNAIYKRMFKWADNKIRREIVLDIEGTFGAYQTASEALAAGVLMASIKLTSSLNTTLTDNVNFELSGDQYNASEFLTNGSTRRLKVRSTNTGNSVGVSLGHVGAKTGFILSLGLQPGIKITSIRVR